MKIAFVTPNLNVGGYEKVIIAYANELAARGHDVDILCGFKKGKLVETVSDKVNIISFNARARSFLFPLMKYLKNYKPDILYCAFRTYNCYGVIAKFLTHSHTCIYATQHGFEKSGKIRPYMEGRIISHADRLITVANGIADYESKCLHIDRERFVVFNNPVLNTEHQIKDEYHPWFDEEIPIIVVAGRIAEDKGKKYCLEIYSKIAPQRPVRMMFLGDGPLLPELKDYAKEHNLEDGVAFMGFVDNPLGYMKHCNIFLHTAIVEGFGNVVVEALYSDITPCISDCTGPMQIIEDGKYGVCLGSVDDENFVENAAESIIDVIDKKVEFTGLVDRALCFEVEKSTDQFLDAYFGKEQK